MIKRTPPLEPKYPGTCPFCGEKLQRSEIREHFDSADKIKGFLGYCNCTGVYKIITKQIWDTEFLDNPAEEKPWKDPESLFCDTKFLDEFFKKKVRRGDECKDK